MTAYSPIVVAGDRDLWDKATHDVNAWRGEAIQHFARAELAVTKTLGVLATQPQGGAKVRLRRLVGQRFEDLAAALSHAGDTKADKAVDVLADFLHFDDIRPLLCHGATKVAIDRNGHWFVIFKLVDIRARGITSVSRTFEERDARALLDGLSNASSRLISALQSVRDNLKPKSRT